MTLAELMTTHIPFDADTATQLIKKITEYDQIGLEEIKENLKDEPLMWLIIKKALAFEPRNRFQNMEEFERALNLFMIFRVPNIERLKNYFWQQRESATSSIEGAESPQGLQDEYDKTCTEIMRMNNKYDSIDELLEAAEHAINLQHTISQLRSDHSS